MVVSSRLQEDIEVRSVRGDAVGSVVIGRHGNPAPTRTSCRWTFTTIYSACTATDIVDGSRRNTGGVR